MLDAAKKAKQTSVRGGKKNRNRIRKGLNSGKAFTPQTKTRLKIDADLEILLLEACLPIFAVTLE